MNGEQIRAARAILKWSAKDLSEASGVSWATIQRLESKDGPLAGYEQTRDALRAALELRGVCFLEAGQVATGPGVSITEPRGEQK